MSLPVADALAPLVTDAVGVRETERERLCVLDGVTEDVGVPEDVPVPVIVPLVETVDDPVGVTEGVGVTDALAPSDSEGVGVLLRDAETVVVPVLL